jgi:DUF1009 family protein
MRAVHEGRTATGQSRPAVGLIAGWGRYPILVAEAIQAQGLRVCCVGLRGHADPVLQRICDQFAWLSIPRVGAHIRYFRRHRVVRATMAGKLFKSMIFRHALAWWRFVPDFTTMRYLGAHFITNRADRKDDSLLGAFTRAYNDHGIEMFPATDLAPHLLVDEGVLTRATPTGDEWRDVQFGWQLAKEMGRLDVGQSVVVRGRAVLAVEAVEGTDECIRRGGTLCPGGGFTVVKVAKPQQDMRFDVPTIGVGTIHAMRQAGARVLAIEAGKTVILDRDELVSLANQFRLAIVALHDAQGSCQKSVA